MRMGTKRLAALAVSAALCGSAFAAMTDGTYTGEGKGRNGTITVEVTVKAGKLDAVKVVKRSASRMPPSPTSRRRSSRRRAPRSTPWRAPR